MFDFSDVGNIVLLLAERAEKLPAAPLLGYDGIRQSISANFFVYSGLYLSFLIENSTDSLLSFFIFILVFFLYCNKLYHSEMHDAFFV